MKYNQKLVCRICGNSQNNKTFLVPEMMIGTREGFLYFECSVCKCIQIAEIPSDMTKYYPSGYYSLKKKKEKKLKILSAPLEKARIKLSVSTQPGLIGHALNKLLPPKNVKFLQGMVENRHVKILDVGCGNGQKFLLPLYKAGYKKVAGCDPYINDDIIQAGEPPVYKKELQEMEGEWDIITFNHSFEHLHNPMETLRQAWKLLKKDGCCIIRIPTASSYAWKHYRTNWFQLDAPRHFFIHSVESIRFLSEKTDFILKNIVYDSTHHQFTLSERYKMGKTLTERNYSNLAGRLKNVFQKLSYASKAASLNKQKMGDQAVFYLKKG